MRLARPALLSLSMFALILPAAGCGGSGGGGGGGSSGTTITLTSRGSLDGQVESNGTSASAGVFPQVGSTPVRIVRGIYIFDLPASLVGKTIDAATLRVAQISAQPGAYTAYGSIVADHINLQGIPLLSVSAFLGLSLLDDFGTVSTTAALEVKTLDATARVQADLSATRTTSSYRLRFTTETPIGQGIATFSDGEGSSPTAQLPQLVVTFH